MPRVIHRTAAWLILGLMAVAGCGGSTTKPTGTVKGSVTYNGAPLEVGDVNFISTSGIGAQGDIDAGEFSIEGPLEAGEYAVFVTPPLPEPQAPGTAPQAMPKFDLPAKLQQPATSDVKVQVEAGPNDLKIDLKG